MGKGSIKLAACFVALNALDGVLTQVAGSNGTLQELNPVSGYFIGQSWQSFWEVKMVAAVGCVVILLMLSRHYPRQIRKVFIGLVVLMVGVCVVNVIGLI